MIAIKVNDQPRQVSEGMNLRELLVEMNFNKPYMAVAINDAIIPRQTHSEVLLQSNDRIIIVSAVGGG